MDGHCAGGALQVQCVCDSISLKYVLSSIETNWELHAPINVQFRWVNGETDDDEQSGDTTWSACSIIRKNWRQEEQREKTDGVFSCWIRLNLFHQQHVLPSTHSAAYLTQMLTKLIFAVMVDYSLLHLFLILLDWGQRSSTLRLKSGIKKDACNQSKCRSLLLLSIWDCMIPLYSDK